MKPWKGWGTLFRGRSCKKQGCATRHPLPWEIMQKTRVRHPPTCKASGICGWVGRCGLPPIEQEALDGWGTVSSLEGRQSPWRTDTRPALQRPIERCLRHVLSQKITQTLKTPSPQAEGLGWRDWCRELTRGPCRSRGRFLSGALPCRAIRGYKTAWSAAPCSCGSSPPCRRPWS